MRTVMERLIRTVDLRLTTNGKQISSFSQTLELARRVNYCPEEIHKTCDFQNCLNADNA